MACLWTLQNVLLAKRNRFQVQYDDAVQLKEHNEKRAENVRAMLQRVLTEAELREFDVFVSMKVWLKHNLVG